MKLATMAMLAVVIAIVPGIATAKQSKKRVRTAEPAHVACTTEPVKLLPEESATLAPVPSSKSCRTHGARDPPILGRCARSSNR